MEKTDIITALDKVIKCFDQIGIEYFIGGSVASSAYGIARATLDVDLIAKITAPQVDDLVRTLENDYYIDNVMILNAIHAKSSFNLIHLDTMIKIDVFIFEDKPYDLEAFNRRKPDTLDEEIPHKFYLSSPEDVIIRKLQWYQMSDEVLQQQWKDVLGIMKVQSESLDLEYIKKWASKLNLTNLVNRSFSEAGLTKNN